MNELVLDGEIIRSEEPRFTPSGLQVLKAFFTTRAKSGKQAARAASISKPWWSHTER